MLLRNLIYTTQIIRIDSIYFYRRADQTVLTPNSLLMQVISQQACYRPEAVIQFSYMKQ
ncbi:hypothetical protein [Paenibacillus sp. YN15]|uniref:hypothetical protein n=1 Tax=Paenibacillus sp. YN15 TaxID=1742774 RepID=UPI0015EB8EF5|nr:hypothetical protein [Paenibacillus sp. YN15]